MGPQVHWERSREVNFANFEAIVDAIDASSLVGERCATLYDAALKAWQHKRAFLMSRQETSPLSSRILNTSSAGSILTLASLASWRRKVSHAYDPDTLHSILYIRYTAPREVRSGFDAITRCMPLRGTRGNPKEWNSP